MNKKLSKDNLLSIPDARENSSTVELPGYGEVEVRALSLAEHREMQTDCFKSGKFNEKRWYTLLLKNGLKEPEITFDEARVLADKSAGLVSLILAEIIKISGLAGSGGLAKDTVDEDEELFREE